MLDRVVTIYSKTVSYTATDGSPSITWTAITTTAKAAIQQRYERMTVDNRGFIYQTLHVAYFSIDDKNHLSIGNKIIDNDNGEVYIITSNYEPRNHHIQVFLKEDTS